MAEYAIIGFGCAGYYGAKTIRENDPDGKITVFSEHSYSPYNPMLTTYYVANKIPFEGMFPFGDMYKIKEELVCRSYIELTYSRTTPVEYISVLLIKVIADVIILFRVDSHIFHGNSKYFFSVII